MRVGVRPMLAVVRMLVSALISRVLVRMRRGMLVRVRMAVLMFVAVGHAAVLMFVGCENARAHAGVRGHGYGNLPLTSLLAYIVPTPGGFRFLGCSLQPLDGNLGEIARSRADAIPERRITNG